VLTIGNITFKSHLVLAPMAGISDLPYRMINRKLGCELAFTEMISASALVYKSISTARMITTQEDDRPLGIQLLGDDPEMIKRALDIVAGHAFQIIDFNSACPARKVASRGKGAGLLRDPSKLQKLLKVIVGNTDLPVTVKIRSGWDTTAINAVEVALRAQDAGVSGVFIHGRTKEQGYRGKVDYDIIRKVKESLEIPVIASGDALTPTLITRMFDETGCNGVAVARGGLGNPWIFRETVELLRSGELPQRPDASEVAQTMKEHLVSSIAFSGEKIGVIRFRKFFGWYTRGMPLKELKSRAYRAITCDEMLQLIDQIEPLSAGRDKEAKTPPTASTPWGTEASPPRLRR
jgi:nifR3 family TIM-barrel protein